MIPVFLLREVGRGCSLLRWVMLHVLFKIIPSSYFSTSQGVKHQVPVRLSACLEWFIQNHSAAQPRLTLPSPTLRVSLCVITFSFKGRQSAEIWQIRRVVQRTTHHKSLAKSMATIAFQYNMLSLLFYYVLMQIIFSRHYPSLHKKGVMLANDYYLIYSHLSEVIHCINS